MGWIGSSGAGLINCSVHYMSKTWQPEKKTGDRGRGQKKIIKVSVMDWTGPRGFDAVFPVVKTAETQINKYQNQEEEKKRNNLESRSN